MNSFQLVEPLVNYAKRIGRNQVSDVTGHPEIFDGRVKSLHPAIHGPLLCRLEKEEDAQRLKDLGINDRDSGM